MAKGQRNSKGSQNDPQKWAGKNGVGSGPVPLSNWVRDNPFTGTHTKRIGYQSEPGVDLRPERKGK